MDPVGQARVLARSGRQDEAVSLIEASARQGDAEALFMAASWKLLALYGDRDLGLAHRLLEQAAARGHVEAARLRAFLVGNGTGHKSDPAAAKELLEQIAPLDPFAALQLAFLPKMMSQSRADARPTRCLSEDPIVRMIDGLLLETECAYIRALAEPALRPSFVVDPRTGHRIPNPVRTSMGMSFGPMEEDLVIHALNRRVAAASGTAFDCGEPLHVLRYSPGQEYKPHVDALPGEVNQRRWTMLIYLNEDYQGGETEFPDLGIAVRGKLGDALLFQNVGADGQADMRTRHAGARVISGVKWLATRWIRERQYSPWDQTQAPAQVP
jgi:prolyl 4-hydroxylase